MRSLQALINGFFNLENFDANEYEHYEVCSYSFFLTAPSLLSSLLFPLSSCARRLRLLLLSCLILLFLVRATHSCVVHEWSAVELLYSYSLAQMNFAMQ